MTDHMPLSRYTADYAGQDPLRLAVAAAVDAFAKASIEISDLIGCGALAGITGEAQGAQNADGDVQKDLDVRADEIVRAALKPVSWAALASEEAETADISDSGGLLDIAYDPLDGSSNIETNMTVGTIFSIMPTSKGAVPFTQKGSAQIAAGFVVYGPQTSLVLTLGDGVDIFTLDRAAGSYKRIRVRVQIPAECSEYAINASNHRHWEAPVRDFVEECLAGVEGPRGKNFNMRWIAALVAEAYRILIRRRISLSVRCAQGLCRWPTASRLRSASDGFHRRTGRRRCDHGSCAYSRSRADGDSSARAADHGFDQQGETYRGHASRCQRGTSAGCS
jgi:fructose-1,6-bisphosphatase I